MYLGLTELAKDSGSAGMTKEAKQEEKWLVMSCLTFLGRIEMAVLISVVDKTVLEGIAGGTIAEH